jgi:hypothetical protein
MLLPLMRIQTFSGGNQMQLTAVRLAIVCVIEVIAARGILLSFCVAQI